jgi:hypothetical protein
MAMKSTGSSVMENTITFVERNPEAVAEKHRKAMKRYGETCLAQAKDNSA